MSSAVPGPKINYQGNSKIEREIAAEASEPKEGKIKKVSGISVVKTKKPLGKRIAESFGGQDLRTVGQALVFEVVIPATRDLLFDLIKEGGHRAIYGDGPRRTTPINTSPLVGSRPRQTNYSTMSAARPPVVIGSRESPNPLSQYERETFDFSNLVISNRDKAEEFVARMSEAIDQFGTVSVADFYDVLEITGNGFTDQKYGWDSTNFRNVSVTKVREGWIINLPAPIGLA